MAPNDKTVDSKGDKNSLPEGITEKYFDDILEKEFGKGCTIKKLSPIAAFGGGENYASEMLRIEIDVELPDKSTKTVTYIFKAVPSSEVAADMINKLNLFPKEVEMYESILPAFEKLYSDHGKKITFRPKCLKTTSDPYTLVLEDLKNQNFVNAKRQEGLNMEHTLCVLKRLAEFHAASACLYETKGPYSHNFTQGMYNESLRDVFTKMQEGMNKLYRDCMAKWDFGPKYLEKITYLQDSLIDRLILDNDTNENNFNVLNHGDLWVNNIMFQNHEDGTVKETYFIDFQICKYGSPAQDLYYFIMTSPQLDIKLKNFDLFIKYYYDHLVENLKLLEYPKALPKLVDIQIELLRNGFWGSFASLGVLTAVLLDPIKTAGIESFVEANDEGLKFKTAAFTNPRYINAMRDILPFLDNRGLLE